MIAIGVVVAVLLAFAWLEDRASRWPCGCVHRFGGSGGGGVWVDTDRCSEGHQGWAL